MACNGETLRAKEDYLTLFDPIAYMKNYFNTNFNGTSDDLDYMPSIMQFWFETFSQGKILSNHIALHILTHTNTHTHTFTYTDSHAHTHTHTNKYTYIYTHVQTYI